MENTLAKCAIFMCRQQGSVERQDPLFDAADNRREERRVPKEAFRCRPSSLRLCGPENHRRLAVGRYAINGFQEIRYHERIQERLVGSVEDLDYIAAGIDAQRRIEVRRTVFRAVQLGDFVAVVSRPGIEAGVFPREPLQQGEGLEPVR